MEKLAVDYMDPRARASRRWARLRRWAGNLLLRIFGRRGDAAATWDLEFWRDWHRRVVGASACVRHAGRRAVEVRRGVPLCGVCFHEFEGEPMNAAACFEDGP